MKNILTPSFEGQKIIFFFKKSRFPIKFCQEKSIFIISFPQNKWVPHQFLSQNRSQSIVVMSLSFFHKYFSFPNCCIKRVEQRIIGTPERASCLLHAPTHPQERHLLPSYYDDMMIYNIITKFDVSSRPPKATTIVFGSLRISSVPSLLFNLYMYISV